MATIKRISFFIKFLVAAMVIAHSIFIVYLSYSLSDYMKQRSAYDLIDAQYISAIAVGDQAQAAVLKPDRSYLMGVKTRAANQFQERAYQVGIYMTLLTFNFVIMGASSWALNGMMARQQEAIEKAYRRRGDHYPFGQSLAEECDTEGSEGKYQ